MHVVLYLQDFDIDSSTRLPILFFRVIVDTSQQLYDGLFAVTLSAYGMTSSAKLSTGKTQVTQQAKDAWNVTIPGTATWEVYGI